MKKYEYLYTREEDKFIIPMLIRSIRDTGFVLHISVKSVIEKCMSSRSTHSSEPLYTNASYWPKDMECYMNSFSALFLSRIINSGKLTSSLTSDALFQNFEQYLASFDTTHKEFFREVYIASKGLIKLRPIVKDRIEKILKIKTKGMFVDNIDLTTPYQI